MKSIKKAIYFGTITLVIVGLLMASTANIIAQDSETNENKVITQTNKIDIKPTDSVKSLPLENKVIYKQPSNTLGTPLFTAITPAISDSGSDMVLGFYAPDQENVFYSGSPDFGQTWTDGLGWMWDEPPELPDVDGCGDGRFIGTMVPNGLNYDGGAMAKVEISDVSDTENGYAAMYWTWNDVGAGYTNFIDLACGGYTAADPDENAWAYGGFSIIGDHGELGSQTCFFSYQSSSEGNAWIYTLTDTPGSLNGATSTSMDIDQDTLYSYAVYNYDNQGNKDIYVFIMDFGQWGEYSGSPIHEDAWQAFLTTSGNDNTLDVSAFKNNVIIVSERDGNIIAYYAQNPINNDFSEITITTGGTEPRISHYDENKAVCEFIKNGDLYFSYTEDGGVTWSTPKLVSEEPDVQSGDVCAYGYAYESEDTIYFAPTDFSQAILTIESISGGIGISAVIKNIGTAAAENVDWSIVTAGTVFLGGEKSGTIASLAPGASTTIKTGLILGFGTIDVTVTLGPVTKEASGKLLLFYIIGLA
jgi:hypothetical protein